MTYWILNAFFLAGIAIVVVVFSRRRNMRELVLVLLTTLIMLIVTAGFDNLMIAIGLVAYESNKISGIFIGIAPIEDFCYAIAAAVLLPFLWRMLENKKQKKDTR